MPLKNRAKSIIGRLLPIDLAEKLTEYSIAEQPSMSLAASEAIVMPGTTWQDVVERGREELWRRALVRMGADDLLFLEFGVWQGYSIRFFSELNTSPASRFWGFDSFEGLPDSWRGMAAGHFSTKGQMPQIDDDRVRFVKGWFNETLPGVIPALAEEAQGRTLIVHLDADLYSSTLYLLAVLVPQFREFYCVFDEFSGHEIRALYNFLQAFGAEWEAYNHVPWRGDATTVFGKIRLKDDKLR